MVTKSKRLKKKEKYAQGQLAEAQRRIAELEDQLRTQPAANQPQVTSTPPEELRKLEIALAKTQKATETVETEIGWLRQSSDRGTNVRAQARKAVKDAQEKLQAEVMAHKRTLESFTKRIDVEAHAEQKILELREEAKKQQQWFEDHMASSAEVAKQAEQILKNQIAGMEDRHEREKQLWAEVKLQYEVRAQGHTAKINALKTSLDELRAKTDMGTERIRTLLHTHRGKFEKLLTEALAKGWAGWAQQAAELHTFRADHENRAKEGKGFFKLNDESIATVREDLATDYQALADQHLEEVAQILEEYGATELEQATLFYMKRKIAENRERDDREDGLVLEPRPSTSENQAQEGLNWLRSVCFPPTPLKGLVAPKESSSNIMETVCLCLVQRHRQFGHHGNMRPRERRKTAAEAQREG